MCARGLAQKMLNFSTFRISKHVFLHSGPRIQPYAMILKWRGMRWSPLSFLGGAVAWKAPHPRLRRFIFAPPLHPGHTGVVRGRKIVENRWFFDETRPESVHIRRDPVKIDQNTSVPNDSDVKIDDFLTLLGDFVDILAHELWRGQTDARFSPFGTIFWPIESSRRDPLISSEKSKKWKFRKFRKNRRSWKFEKLKISKNLKNRRKHLICVTLG